jgi:hypothetical protein
MNSDNEDETIKSDEKDGDGKPLDMGLAASKVVDQLINEHDSKAVAINNLKVNVKKWIEIVVQENKLSNPAFVFIDELDRCRPSYAVEMLETIKHIFDIPGVVFVVATDTEQLQHAVKAIYGVGFDARVYLSRFFNSRFSLKAPNLENLLEVHCDTKKLSKEYFDKLGIVVWPVNKDYLLTLDNITAVLNAFNLSPRSAIQITERIIATISHLPYKATIDIVMLATLLCIREKDESLYEEIVTKGFDKKEENKALDNYLIECFKITNEYIKIDVNISKYPVFSQISGLRYLESGVYSIDYSYYLKTILCTFFTTGSPIYNFSVKCLDRNISPIEEVVQEFTNLEYNEAKTFFGRSSEFLVKYLQLNAKLNEVEIGLYCDLVELASAIDWLSDEAKIKEKVESF